MKEQRRIELEASRPAPPPPPPPRRQAVKVEGATFGFIPGSALAAETCDAAPVLPDTNAISDNDRFAVLAFHLPTKAVVSAVTACVRVPDSAYLALAIYNETGDRLVKADLRGDASGPVSATVEPPVELPAGNYRLGWAVWPTQPVKFQCLKLDRDSIEMLNAGEGEIVLGVSRGRADARLPKKLGEIEPAGERFPMPPKVLFKG